MTRKSIAYIHNNYAVLYCKLFLFKTQCTSFYVVSEYYSFAWIADYIHSTSNEINKYINEWMNEKNGGKTKLNSRVDQTLSNNFFSL